MKRDKLITILLFLLLLLIILCVWSHSDEIKVNHKEVLTTKQSHKAQHFIPQQKIAKTSIDYHLTKKGTNFELIGNFSNGEDIEKIAQALPANSLQDMTNINKSLQNNSELIALTEKLIPIFVTEYLDGSISYLNESLTIEGSVNKAETKEKIDTLLKSTHLDYLNHTTILTTNPSTKTVTTEKRPPTQTTTEVNKTIQQPTRPNEHPLKELNTQDKKLIQEKAKQKAQAIEAEIQKVIDSEHINFETNRAKLTPKSLTTIDHIATILQKYPNIFVKIEGHTDSDGSKNYNLTLSQKRVDRVKQKLIDLGISATRLTSIGYGETQPFVPNNNSENKRLNRRVEFKIEGE